MPRISHAYEKLFTKKLAIKNGLRFRLYDLKKLKEKALFQFIRITYLFIFIFLFIGISFSFDPNLANSIKLKQFWTDLLTGTTWNGTRLSSEQEAINAKEWITSLLNTKHLAGDVICYVYCIFSFVFKC